MFVDKKVIFVSKMKTMNHVTNLIYYSVLLSNLYVLIDYIVTYQKVPLVNHVTNHLINTNGSLISMHPCMWNFTISYQERYVADVMWSTVKMIAFSKATHEGYSWFLGKYFFFLL